MKKFFSLVLALVMALSLTTVAFGATTVTDLAGLQNALDAGETDIVVEGVDFTSNPFNGKYYKDRNIDFVDCTFTANMNYMYINDVTFTNCTFDCGSDNSAVHYDELFGDAVFNNCIFTSGKIQIGTSENATVTFNNCVFADTAGTSIWSDKGIRVYCPAEFNGCEFNNRVALAGSNDLPMNFNSCTMNGGTPVYYNGNSDGIISGGNVPFVGTNVTMDANGKYTGGTFFYDVSPYLASTAGFVTNPDGSVTVGAKATTGTYDLYSCNNTAVAAATGLSYTKVAAAPKTDGTGTIAYVAVDNGKNYMEISSFEATKADFYVTVSGSKTAVMYLREVSTVSYVASAKEFTNFGYGCGQYTKAYGDTSKYYQVLDGAYKNRVFRAETTGLGFLVDGKIVQLATEVTLNAHTWSATAVDTVTGVPTKAICGKCSTTGTVYASAAKVPAAAVIDVTALSYNGVSYPVVAGYKTVAGPVTGTTDKVQSAETFDAGIAMYVGMSVMAAAGSAVVIGKKKD